jgi:hypothetical protein
MLQGDGCPGKALDQGAPDGAQPIGATEITFDIGDTAIEWRRPGRLHEHGKRGVVR